HIGYYKVNARNWGVPEEILSSLLTLYRRLPVCWIGVIFLSQGASEEEKSTSYKAVAAQLQELDEEHEERAARLDWNWARAAVVMAFRRSHAQHPLRDSVLSPIILQPIQALMEVEPETAAIDLAAFMRTRFFQEQVQVQPSEEPASGGSAASGLKR